MASEHSSHARVSTQPQDWSESYACDSSAKAAPPFSFQAKERAGGKTSNAGGVLGRLLFLVLGVFLVIAGVLMLVLPGPGLLTIGAGAFCISRAFKRPARKA